MNTSVKPMKLDLKFFSLVLIGIASILWFYFPGLTGGYMLDDWSTLPTLFDNIENCGFICGVLSGSAGPTGRPISLLSFALQGNEWLANAYFFKLVNVVIHICNTALLVFVFYKVLKLLGYDQIHSCFLSLFSGVLWAIWPLQVSSVLYVVQRMALLSNFFVLLSIAIYLHWRPRFVGAKKEDLPKFFLYALMIFSFGVLGMFSKENAVLLLVYVLVLESTFFTGLNSSTKIESHFRLLALVLPVGFLVVFIFYKVFKNPDLAYLAREFDWYERLLTQGRVLTDYLSSLLLPKASALGLYHDSYIPSRGIFDPITTAISWVLILSSIAAAFLFKRRWRLFSIAVLWFFGGHILESTILPLELYFEHRNYLPISFVTLFLVVSVYRFLSTRETKSKRHLLALFPVCYLLMLILVGRAQTTLWGDELKYGLVQAAEHADSIRARSLLVDAYSRLGDIDKAYEETQKMKGDFPRLSGVIVSDIEFVCFDARYKLEAIDSVVDKLEEAKFGYSAIATLSRAVVAKSNNGCEGVSLAYLLEVTRAIKRNPLFAKKLHLLHKYELNFLMMDGKIDEALELYRTIEVPADHWSRYIGLLATKGRLKEALIVSRNAIEVLKGDLESQIYYRDVMEMQEVIIAELEEEDKSN